MSLYARSDMMSISIPETSGGCGAGHQRPVTRGAPAKVWKLDCPRCESYLRGDGKAKVIKVITGDKEAGIPNRLEHVVDSDPHWSTTVEGIPATPDEQHVNKIRSERGDQELRWLEALIAARGSNISIPDNAMWRLEQTFGTQVVGSIVSGTVLCANNHENPAGTKHCSECGIKMNTRGVLTQAELDAEPEAEIPLDRLHVASLKKMAREKGLSDKGTKAQILERLSA